MTLSLDLFRRLPPQNLADNLQALCECLPDLADDLLGSIDQPLTIKVDSSSREYLVSTTAAASTQGYIGLELTLIAVYRPAITTGTATRTGKERVNSLPCGGRGRSHSSHTKYPCPLALLTIILLYQIRSPWTNSYDPPLSDGTAPSDNLRQLEQRMNEAFDIYRDL